MSKGVVRAATCDSDFALIYATWRNALWFAEKRDPVLSDDFYRDASRMIKDKLKGADVRMACLADDDDMLIGWAVLKGSNLEFVYVKMDYRRCGVARLLTKGLKSFSPPQTRVGKKLARKLEQEKTDGRKEEKGQTAQDDRP